jgi:anti-sigma regulatory factor (Ser/Thr protein kinase)
MISDIIKVIQTLLSADTWTNLSKLVDVVSSRHEGWEKDVRTSHAKFRRSKTFEVTPYLNSLLQEMRDAGVAAAQVEEFAAVFKEIIDNAFVHGCSRKDGPVKVLCYFCRYFIFLTVTDPGAGFDLEKAIASSIRRSADREVNHGLALVDDLAYERFSKKQGNAVSVVLRAQPSFEVAPTPMQYKDREYLEIAILSDDAWYEIITDWKPILQVIETAPQRHFLIDLTTVHWISRAADSLVREINGYPEERDVRFVFLINRGAHWSFKLKSYDDARPPIFQEHQREQALEWLLDKGGRG